MLFVSPHDSIRGPMAEAFALAHRDDATDFFSAGLVPAGFVRPQAISVLQEKGLEVSWEHPRFLLPEHMIGVDYLVAISCDVDANRMRHFKGKVIRWKVEHPLNKGLDVDFYRQTRSNVENKVKELLEALRSGSIDQMVEQAPETAEAA